MNDAVLALPFDQYQRYRLVSDLLRELRGAGPQLHVLDVGGRTAVLREFLEDARIDLVDMEPSNSPGLVLGDGARLPFKDGAFDVVCAFDTLEHVPAPLRAAFVAECRRVARRWVILAGPYADERVAQAEALLQSFLKNKLGEAHRYLDEHRQHGLPERAAVEEQLRASGARTAAIPHGNLERWLVLQCLSMYLDYDPALRELGHDFQRWYNAALYASDHAAPCYRHVVVAAFAGAALPDATRLLSPPVAPAGALSPFAQLTPALLAFDAERDRWRAERREFEHVVGELRADVESHRVVIAGLVADKSRLEGDLEHVVRELREEGERYRVAMDALVADRRRLEGDLEHVVRELREEGERYRVAMDALVADRRRLEGDLERVCRDVEAERNGFRAALAALESDLGGHRAALALAHEELGGLRTRGERAGRLAFELATLRKAFDERNVEHEREAADLRKLLVERERELDGERAARAETERDLAGHRASLAAVQADLAGHRSALEAQQAQLEQQRAAREALERDLEGHRAAREALERDLEGHREALRATRVQLEEHRQAVADLGADLAGHRRALETLERDLAGEHAARTQVEAALARSDADLRRTLQLAGGLENSLAERELVYDALRRELRSRWRNLLRVFRPLR
jgi:septal ring factor EnvC (AmiA/AmiB activator)